LLPVPPAKTIVWVPIVNEEAFTVSIVAVEAQALILGEVVPVTERLVPTVRSVFRVVLAPEFRETKIVLPLGVNRKPLIDPSPE
jgi:hypothetical protein